MSRPGRTVVADAAVAVALGVVSTFGFATWFSRRLFTRAAFEGQYDHGVYRPRVLGRELVLGVHRLIGNPIPDWVAPSARAQIPTGSLYSAVTLVNLAAFLGLAALLHVAVGRAGLPEPHRTLVFVTATAIVAATGYVVTPYDQLSYALLLAALLAATARPPIDLATPLLVALGVATRESNLLALAALWAMWWAGRGDRRQAIVASAATVTGVATYVLLRLALADGGDVSWWSTVTLAGNIGRVTGWIGMILLGALVIWWHQVARVAGFGQTAAARRVVARYRLLAVAYLVVAGLTGYWFEVRLLAPVLVAEVWVRASAGGGTGGRSPAARTPAP